MPRVVPSQVVNFIVGIVSRVGGGDAVRMNSLGSAKLSAVLDLSGLPVWWLRLGITIERIQPVHPQQNGRHERMHRTLNIEAKRPAGSNFLQQQAKFDTFVPEFNDERPHEALAMKCPADVYQPSTRQYRGLAELSYPFHDRTVLVNRRNLTSSRPPVRPWRYQPGQHNS